MSEVTTRRVSVSESQGKVALPNDVDHDFLQNPSNFATRTTVGGHCLISDLKVIEKGADMGPSPKELLYSALGSCTVMTIRTFFDNTKGIAGSSWKDCRLSNILVTVDEIKGLHKHVPVGLSIAIELEGNLTQIQKDRLLRVANNCPVKMMIGGGLEINSRLVSHDPLLSLELKAT